MLRATGGGSRVWSRPKETSFFSSPRTANRERIFETSGEEWEEEGGRAEREGSEPDLGCGCMLVRRVDILLRLGVDRDRRLVEDLFIVVRTVSFVSPVRDERSRQY
jgi:hypothetical protein